MKINTLIVFIIILCGCFYGCFNSDCKKESEPQPVAFTIVNKSPLFTEKNISFKLDSVNNTMLIKLTVNGNSKLPFPIDPVYHDTLCKTAFNFDLYCNNKIILTDYTQQHDKCWNKDKAKAASNFSFSSDTVDLRQNNIIQFKIPFYAFHTLKKGKQTIELNLTQNIFINDISNASTKRPAIYSSGSAVKTILSARIKFNINVPVIYKSIVYGYGLELKNDSTFSPSGMDNTIWKSSYPDIYWMIYYPTNLFYTKTDYQTSTDKYTAHDTFNLYHYYPNDSIGIGVYDHDNLSRDDGLGYWTGPLARLSKSPVNRITFGNVKAFDVKVVKKGIVN